MKIDLENRIIRGGIIFFWWLFWLTSFTGKLLAPGYLWFSDNMLAILSEYFAPLNLGWIAFPALALVGILECLAILFLTVSLVSYLGKKDSKAHNYLFYGTLCGLVIFSIFTIGDQLLQQRISLSQHTVYWIAIVISWYIYTHSERLLELYLNHQ